MIILAARRAREEIAGSSSSGTMNDATAYLLESLIKVMANLAPHVAGWNVLDFIVVAFGLLELSSVLDNYTFIRVLRILRPLRIISKIPELKIIVEAFVASMPMMTDTLFLALFYYAIFGILCLQIFMGQLRGRCGTPDFSGSFIDTSSGGNFIRVSM